MPNTTIVNTKYFAGTTTFKKYPYKVAKFLHENPEAVDSDVVMYLRVSEMHLIEVESLAKPGKDSEAADILSFKAEVYAGCLDVAKNIVIASDYFKQAIEAKMTCYGAPSDGIEEYGCGLMMN